MITLKFTGKFQQVDLNLPLFFDRLLKALQKELEQGVVAFLEAWREMPKKPLAWPLDMQYTGALRRAIQLNWSPPGLNQVDTFWQEPDPDALKKGPGYIAAKQALMAGATSGVYHDKSLPLVWVDLVSNVPYHAEMEPVWRAINAGVDAFLDHSKLISISPPNFVATAIRI